MDNLSEYKNTIKQKDLEINEKNVEISKLQSKLERVTYNYEDLDVKYDKIVKSISKEQLRGLLD